MSKHPKIRSSDLITGIPPLSVTKIIGLKFGKLEILSFAGFRITKNGQKYPYLNCLCDCGNKSLTAYYHIKNKKIISCGCYRVTNPNRLVHGYAPLRGKRDKIYVTWQSINKRCYNKNDKGYAGYGLKGICVCSGWRGADGFKNFKNDMGEPTNKSIDRIDNNLHYSCGHCDECIKNNWPLNCRWADDFIQSNNRGNFNNWITIDGIKMTYRQADRYLGFKPKTIQSRIKTYGWSEEKAITTPIKTNK